MLRTLLLPWVDLTRFSLEWSRWCLDHVELVCDTLEDEGGY